MIKKDRWVCDECHKQFLLGELLEAPNPFDLDEKIYACPHCKTVNDFTQLCDEAECNRNATCGISTKTGYRRVCGKHYKDLYTEKEADTWKEPDDTTPDNAAGYGRKTIIDSDTGKPFVHWQCASIKMLRLTGYTDIVLAKENQGPPPIGGLPFPDDGKQCPFCGDPECTSDHK